MLLKPDALPNEYKVHWDGHCEYYINLSEAMDQYLDVASTAEYAVLEAVYTIHEKLPKPTEGE